MIEYTLMSDLHLDFSPEFSWPLKELVIVAGDTANGLGGVRFLNALKQHGHTVFAVDGNHEHYTPFGTLLEREHAFVMDVNGPLLLGNRFNIFGVNGWYQVADEKHWRGRMRDGRYVTAQEVNDAAKRHAKLLDGLLEKSTRPAVVVTHTSPCEETLDPKFAGADHNAYFWNPLLRPLLDKHTEKIIRWHHGHTHHGMRTIVSGVEVVSNPRGYPGENPSWEPLHLAA